MQFPVAAATEPTLASIIPVNSQSTEAVGSQTTAGDFISGSLVSRLQGVKFMFSDGTESDRMQRS
jgi:hypothetical protein